MTFSTRNSVILMFGLMVGARLGLINIRNKLRLTRMAKLKTKLEVCCTVQVKRGLTRSSGPNLHNFTEASEEECLLSKAEGGGGVVQLVKTGLDLFPVFISNMADKILQLQLYSSC